MTTTVSPRIGIYWLHDGRILGLTCSLARAEPGVPGLLDSPFTHIDAWPQVRAAGGLPSHLEYDDLPRGRVLYALGAQASIVYGDKALIGSPRSAELADRVQHNRDAILAFFALVAGTVIWRHDSHYTVGIRRINQLFDSDGV